MGTAASSPVCQTAGPAAFDLGTGTNSTAQSGGAPPQYIRCPAQRYTGAGWPRHFRHRSPASMALNVRSPLRMIASRIGITTTPQQCSSSAQAGQSERRWSRRKAGGCMAGRYRENGLRTSPSRHSSGVAS